MKLTDTEIKKALDVLKSWRYLAYHNDDGTDEDSHELYEALTLVFDLINRQQAEIKRLKQERDKEHNYCNHYARMCAKAKSEAYKEFTDKLLRKATFMRDEETINGVVRVGDIYETLEETGGGKNG